MESKVFWGQRQTTYMEAKTDILQVCFGFQSIYPVIIAGQVASHLKCGLIEAEGILERMVTEGDIRYASKEETARAHVTFGYVAKK
jgi:hypothetical protein